MKKFYFLVSILGIIGLIACGLPGDPIIEDLYTQNVYPGSNNTYNIGSPALQYNNIYAKTANFTNLLVGGRTLSSPAYGELYVTTAIATTCTQADIYYLVSGNTTADELQDFTHNSLGRLTYIGTDTRVSLVTAAISVSSDTNNVVLSTKAYINGSAHEASLIQRKIATAGDIGAQAIIVLLPLATDDYVEIYIASDKAGAKITFVGMSLTVTTVD